MNTWLNYFGPLRPLGLCALCAVLGCEPGLEAPADTGPAVDAGPAVSASTEASVLAPPPAASVDAGQPVVVSDSATAPRAEDASLATSPDAAAQPPDATAPAEPLEGGQGEWVYNELPDTTCRDGSPAGVAVSFGTAPDKLMIYLEGGGQCSDAQTCEANPFFAGAFVLLLNAGLLGTDGIFDRGQPENPLRDWSFVYVPYCTGDKHAGAHLDAEVPGVGKQQFAGYLNMQKFLPRIVATFPGVKDVLLTGISAGGHGAANTSILVQRAFPAHKIKLVIDSGPILPSSVYAACWQERHRLLWKLDDTILRDCGAACPNPNDYALDYGEFLARSFADRPAGFISPTGDAVERSFYAIGNDNCTGTLSFLFLDPGMSVETYRAGILAYRERIRPYANFSTFLVDSEEHTYLNLPDFYTIQAGGVRLVDWFGKIVRGESPGHAGP